MKTTGTITPKAMQIIEERRLEAGLSERALSIQADGSGDLIRNWKRKIKDGKTTSPRLEKVLGVATALGLTLPELLGEPAAMPAPPCALAESAEPFDHPPDDLRALIRALAPGARTVELFRATAPAPAFAILPGDILALDLARAPRDGDITVVQVRDESTATAHWIIARIADPWILPGGAGALPVRTDPARADHIPHGVLVATLRGEANPSTG